MKEKLIEFKYTANLKSKFLVSYIIQQILPELRKEFNQYILKSGFKGKRTKNGVEFVDFIGFLERKYAKQKTKTPKKGR